MPRTSEQWRAFVADLVSRVTPAFERAGLPPSPQLQVTLGGTHLLTYDHAATALVLGLPADPSQDAKAREFWADLLSARDDAELEKGLELLYVRLGLHMFARHIRRHHDAATEDEWVEAQVADAIAYAASARLIDPHEPFLNAFLPRAIEELHQRRILALPIGGAPDPATTEVGEALLNQVTRFLSDIQRTDFPPLADTLAALVAMQDRSSRRIAESELVLMQTLSDGPVALRRTAAEIFAEEASAEAIAKLLSSPRTMPPDVRFMLSAALRERGNLVDSARTLTQLATGMRTPPPVAAAASLLLDDPAEAGVDPRGVLAELEDQGLVDCLKLVKGVTTTAGVAAVWPVLAHPNPAARKEAYRLLGRILPEQDAWAGVSDPEGSIRATSVPMLTPRPGLARAIGGLLLDEERAVRDAALARAKVDDGLTNDVQSLLGQKETDDARRALAALVSHRHPELAEEMLGRVIIRAMRPYTLAVAAARSVDSYDRHLALVEKLAADALDRQRRETIELASAARGRTDWVELFEAAQASTGLDADEAEQLFAAVLPEGWYRALNEPGEKFDAMIALRSLAVTHPEPFVRAAILLFLARAGHEPTEAVARMAEQDPTSTVAEVARILRATGEDAMALTAIEKALFLRTVPLFRSVPTPSLLAIAGAMRATTHAPGEVIVKQGELGDRLFVLHEGSAQARKEQPNGAQTTLATLQSGAVFGEMSLFDSEPRSASVVAAEQCQTLMLDGQTFHRLGVQYPDILWEICRVLTNRLRALGQGVGPRPAPRAPVPPVRVA